MTSFNTHTYYYHLYYIKIYFFSFNIFENVLSNYTYKSIEALLIKHNVAYMKVWNNMSDLATDLGPEMEKSNLAMNISKSFITTDKTPDVQVWTRS